MFYEKGVDISSCKSMFNFLNEHFQYPTLNSWNCMYSIAHNVKLYNLGLTGDPWKVLKFLESQEYQPINDMIEDWECEHSGYSVGFNGRSGGYIVLYNKDNMLNVIPDDINGWETYEDWKSDIKGWGYNVSDFLYKLRELTKLVRDFDKLCDALRDYCDQLSTRDLNKDVLEYHIDMFNQYYEADLEQFGASSLTVAEDGLVDITDIYGYKALLEALTRECEEDGYTLEFQHTDDGRIFIKYEE